MTGIFGIIGYWGVIISLVDYYKTFMNVSDETIDRFDVWKEGAMPGFGMFMVCLLVFGARLDICLFIYPCTNKICCFYFITIIRLRG